MGVLILDQLQARVGRRVRVQLLHVQQRLVGIARRAHGPRNAEVDQPYLQHIADRPPGCGRHERPEAHAHNKLRGPRPSTLFSALFAPPIDRAA